MKKTSILSVILTGLWVLLAFLLIFDQKLAIPLWMSPLGRLHPLILHLPIGLFLGLWLLLGLKNYIEQQNFKKIYKIMSGLIAILAVITAIAGLFLSKEESDIPQKLIYHKYTGAAFALLSVILFEFNAIEKKWFQILKLFSTLILIVSGHLGGEITHGENYLFGSLVKNVELAQLKDESNIYTGAVYPILKTKCVSCHNDQKNKGSLNMTSIEKLLKGGKNGSAIKIGDALNSHIIKRANLPLEDKKHMPPKGKPQLTESELKILTAWINNGADTKKKLGDIKSNPAYYGLFISAAPSQKIEKYDFSSASEGTLRKINTPFCVVEPIAAESPALKASFYVSNKFDSKSLENLKQVNEQLIELNLSKMPLNENDLKVVSSLGSLRKLNLNATGIKPEYIKLLSGLKNLHSLSISNNKLIGKVLEYLSEIKSLKNLYAWETGIEPKEIKNWTEKHPGIKVETGFNPEGEPPLKLNSPRISNKKRVLNNGEQIKIEHPLKGVEIRYTLDGSEPDSQYSSIFNKPITIDGFKKIKSKAYKVGWISSGITESTFFVSIFKALEAKILSPADKQYQAFGPETIIDLKEGDMDNFKDGSWLGFRDNNAEFLIKTEKANGISLSWLVNPGSYIMPPKNVKVYGSNDGKNFSLIQNINPTPLTKYVSKFVDGHNLPLTKKYTYFKVVMVPLSVLPNWHEGKGQRGWVFIDEVYFW